MAVTVAEVLADAKLRDLNRTLIHNEISSAKTKLLAAAGGDGSLTFVSVPVLFLGMADPMVFTDGQTAYHFTPGAVNLQIVGDSYYLPRQFGPRSADGKDIFEEDIRSRLANALFVDDWKVYHDFHGEVHCGSLVKREVWNKDWWAMQP